MNTDMHAQELMLLQIEQNFQPTGPPPQLSAASAIEENPDLKQSAPSWNCTSSTSSGGNSEPTLHIARSTGQLRRLQAAQKTAVGYWKPTLKSSNNAFVSCAKFENSANMNTKATGKKDHTTGFNLASRGVTNKFRRIIQNYVDGEKR
jgi:hypothetical protein